MTTQLFQSGGVQTTVILPQIIYLDFDGALTRYNGEILAIDSVTVEDSGLTAERVAAITAMLNQQFRDQNVEFVTEKPASGDYSTIFVGKTSSFAPYGSFAGLAETVDSGNKIHNDNAFVMLDSLSSNDRITDVIAHEAGHLLGTLDHGGEGLARYAESYEVSSGVTSTGVVLWYDYMHVYSGGTANDTTVSGGTLYVRNGGTANDTTVASGELYVWNGGTANGITVSDGGRIVVYYGGTATDIGCAPWESERVRVDGGAVVTYASRYSGVFLASGGTLLSSAKTVSNMNIEDSCSMYVMSGGTANNTTVNSGGDLYVDYGGTVNSTAVNGGSMNVSSGGEANRTSVYGGSVNVSSGGTASIVAVSGGRLYVSSGGTASYVIWTPCEGYIDAEEGAVVTYVSSYSGVYLGSDNTLLSSAKTMSDKSLDWAGAMYIMSDGTASYTSVSGGDIDVRNGGTANHTQLLEGSLRVSSGGIVNYTYVYGEFPCLDVYNGGTANDTTLTHYGSLCISSGGTANRTSLDDGGTLYISNGGIAYNTVLNSRGRLYVEDGGTANSTVVNRYGSLCVSSGGTATVQYNPWMGFIVEEEGGKAIILDRDADVYYLNQNLETQKGNTVSNVTLADHQSAIVYSGGAIENLVVERGGIVELHKGGTVNGFTATSALTMKDGLLLQGMNVFGRAYLNDYNTVNDTQIFKDGSLFLRDGARAVQTTVQGTMFVGFESVAENIAVSGGSVYVMGGGEIKGNISISQEGAVYLYGGSIVNGDIHVKGTLVVDEDMVNHGTIVLNLIGNTQTPMLTGYSMMTGNRELAADISNAGVGTYALADDADTFSGELTLMSSESALGCVSEKMAVLNDSNVYALNTENDVLSLDVTESELPSDCAQILWNGSSAAQTFQCSNDNFRHTLAIVVDGNALDCYALAEGEGAYRVTTPTATVSNGSYTVEESGTKRYVSDADDNSDLFFAKGSGVWGSGYAAQHVGYGSWTGTGEQVDLAGKNQITDVFEGSTDANILVMTDDANGDALFMDDIYSAFPEEQQARIAQINEIRAGQGDDIVDMTSQRFAYSGNGVTIRGGAGDDTIWANSGNNKLFGDAGNDRIVGASGNDVIVGGSGNDSMHGGGGDDIFCFCIGWGTDTVEQLSGGNVTLWFAEGSRYCWDQDTMTYTAGSHSVKVSGVTKVTLKFGDDGSELYDTLAAAGCFMDESSEKIWEESGKGVIAQL